MKTTDLRQLIKESIQEYIKEIDEAGNRAALEAKIAKTQEAIDLRKKKLNMEGLDEAYHDMMDKGKMKEMTSEIKLLEKSMGKYKKMLEKMDAKDTPKMEEMQDDKVEEEIIDETNLDEYTADPASELEEAKMTKAEKAKKEDIVKGMKKSKSFGKSKEGKSEMYATATKLAMKESTEIEGEVLNEQFLHMQKLAGLITETQYKKKMQMLNEIEIKVGSIYVYEHPKAGPVKVKALGKSEWGDEYFTIEALEDKGEVRKGNQYNAEIEKLTVTEGEYKKKRQELNEAKIPSFRIKQVLTPFGMDKPDPQFQADLRVGLNYVIPKKSYSDMSDIQQHMGKVTKIEGDKVFLETPKGEQQYKISDLVYISNASS